MARQRTLNDTDRAQWIDNDEPLYRAWLASRKSKRQFIREHRQTIDWYINNLLNQEPKS